MLLENSTNLSHAGQCFKADIYTCNRMLINILHYAKLKFLANLCACKIKTKVNGTAEILKVCFPFWQTSFGREVEEMIIISEIKYQSLSLDLCREKQKAPSPVMREKWRKKKMRRLKQRRHKIRGRSK